MESDLKLTIWYHNRYCVYWSSAWLVEQYINKRSILDFEWNQTFIHCDLRTSTVHNTQQFHPLVPDISDCCQFVSDMPCSSWLKIVKSEYCWYGMEHFQGHGGMKYWSSCLSITQTRSSLTSAPVNTSQY